MKPSYFVKPFLLALPFLFLVYVFVIRDRLEAGGGVGGGMYDLTKLYTLVIVGFYLLVVSLVLVIQDGRQNLFFLLAGIVQLVAVIVLFVRTL